eukprot:815547-Pelagomonas_calceolata.AAC.3
MAVRRHVLGLVRRCCGDLMELFYGHWVQGDAALRSIKSSLAAMAVRRHILVQVQQNYVLCCMVRCFAAAASAAVLPRVTRGLAYSPRLWLISCCIAAKGYKGVGLQPETQADRLLGFCQGVTRGPAYSLRL